MVIFSNLNFLLMDYTHIHLILTHFPIVGTLIATAILAYGIFAKEDSVKKAALVLLFVLALISIPVFVSGEKAEHSVEHLAGVSEHFIEEHEELAEKAIWLMAFLGALSLGSFITLLKNHKMANTLTILTFVMALITFGVFSKVGNLGGQIRHSEIRSISNTQLHQTDFEDESDEEENMNERE